MSTASYRKFTKDVGLVGLANVLRSAGSLILLPVLTKTWGAGGYGIWEQIGATVTLLAPFVTLGMSGAMLRFLAGERDKGKIRDGFFSSVATILLSGSLFGLLFISLSGLIGPLVFGEHAATSRLIQATAALALVQALSNVGTGYFMTFRQMGRFAAFSLSSDLARIGLVIGAVLLGYGLSGAIWSSLLVYAAIFVLSSVLIVSQIGIGFPTFSPIKEYLAYSLPALPAAYAWWLFASSNRYVIMHFDGVRAVGLYAAAYGLGCIPYTMLLTPLYSVLLPTVTDAWENSRLEETRDYIERTIKYALLLTIPAAFGLASLGKPLIEVVSSAEFAPAAALIPFIAAGFVPLGISAIAQMVFNLIKKTGLITLLYTGAGAINLLLNLILVPRISVLGSAIATCATYCALAIATQLVASKYLKIRVPWLFAAKSVVASAVMSLLIWWVGPRSLLQLAGAAILGAAVYFATLFLLKGFSRGEIRFLLSLGGLKTKSGQGVLCGSEKDVMRPSMDQSRERDTFYYNGREFTKEQIIKYLDLSRKNVLRDSRVIETMKLIEGSYVLDVGCASGDWSRMIAEEKQCRVLGIDLLDTSIEIANKFNQVDGVEFRVGDIFDMHFADDTFDCVVFLETIEHVYEPATFLREFHRILKPGGFLVLSTPNATSYHNLLRQLFLLMTRSRQLRAVERIATEPRDTGTQRDHIYNWDFETLFRLANRCGFDYVDHRFVRALPVRFSVKGVRISLFGNHDMRFLVPILGPLLCNIVLKLVKPDPRRETAADTRCPIP